MNDASASAGTKGSGYSLALVLCGLLLAITAFHLNEIWSGHADYRAQHLGTALEYAKGHINLLRPIVVGFNANDQPTPQELPVWQAVAALLFKAFGTWFGWACVTSLLYFALGLWPLFQLAQQYLGRRGAWWTLIFYCAQPLVFYMAGHGGTDGSCVSFAICFLYCADILVRGGRWIWWLPTTAFAVLSAITKLPLFFCVGLTSFFLLLLHGRASLRRWLQLGSAGLVAALALLLWQRYCDACIARAEFPFVDLRLSAGSDVGNWYFGDWSFRLNPRNWIKGGWRVLSAVLGSFALGALPLWSVFRSRTRIGRLWLAAALLTVLVFTQLILVHVHYYLMFSPAVALLAAEAAVRLEDVSGFQHLRGQILIRLGAAGLLLAATTQGLVALNVVLDADPATATLTAAIREYTQPQDKLLIRARGWGGGTMGWGGEQLLILSGRNGLSIGNTQFLENPKNLARIQELGYTKLVMVSESPLHYWVQATKPGQLHLPRDTYNRYLTPVVQGWETLLQNDDILIKAVPR